MPRARRWTDEQLIAAVAASACLREVWLELGITPGAYRNLRAHIARLGLDTNHFVNPESGPPGNPGPRRSWTDEDLAEAVRSEVTVAGVIRRLGHEPNGGRHRQVVSYIRTLGLDTSHFVGQSWAKGRRFTHRCRIRWSRS